MPIEFRPSAELFPFTSRWFESKAGRVHYIDEGRGRPILFLHGNPTWSFLYRNIIFKLRDRFRCVAVDYLGFGLSERPDGFGYSAAEHAVVVGELIRGLDLRDFIVMGQDWGGPIGIACALTVPQRISGLVFGNTWFWPADRLRTKMFSRLMGTRLMQRRILEQNYFVNRLIPAGTSRRLPPEVMEHYRQVQPTHASRVGVAEFPKQLLAAGPWLSVLDSHVVEVLGQKRLLLVWGMRDFAFPARHFLPRWQRSFSNSAFVPLPFARHFIQEDAPDEIARAILKRFG